MIALNRPLDTDQRFRKPQTFARALAAVIEAHPQVIALTGSAHARNLRQGVSTNKYGFVVQGVCVDADDKDASRFCAIGSIRRFAGIGVDQRKRSTSPYVTHRLVGKMDRLLGMPLPTWFESTKPGPEGFRKLLLVAAADFDREDREHELMLAMTAAK